MNCHTSVHVQGCEEHTNPYEGITHVSTTRNLDGLYVCPNGDRKYYRHGKLHRDGNRAAVFSKEGTRIYYRNGKMHRDNQLPALIGGNGDVEFFVGGELHCTTGPAVVWLDGVYEFWVEGCPLSEDKFLWRYPAAKTVVKRLRKQLKQIEGTVYYGSTHVETKWKKSVKRPAWWYALIQEGWNPYKKTRSNKKRKGRKAGIGSSPRGGKPS